MSPPPVFDTVFQLTKRTIIERTDLKSIEDVGRHNRTWVRVANIQNGGRMVTFGDLHSSMRSFCVLLEEHQSLFMDGTLKLRENHYIAFTGDIVDRGPFGYHMLLLVSTLYNENPDQVFICSGNHEECSTYSRYGLADEAPLFGDHSRCTHGLQRPQDETSKLKFVDYFPCACVVNTPSGRILLNHGAAPVNVPEFIGLLATKMSFEIHDEYEVLNCGDYTARNVGLQPSERGAGLVVPFHLAAEFMEKADISQIISGHQDMASYGCFTEPYVDSDKYFDISDRINNNPYVGVAWLIQSYGLSVDVAPVERVNVDVTHNKVHVHSSAVYPKYDPFFMGKHCFMSVNF